MHITYIITSYVDPWHFQKKTKLVGYLLAQLPFSDLCSPQLPSPSHISNAWTQAAAFECGISSMCPKHVPTAACYHRSRSHAQHSHRYNVMSVYDYVCLAISVSLSLFSLSGSVWVCPCQGASSFRSSRSASQASCTFSSSSTSCSIA